MHNSSNYLQTKNRTSKSKQYDMNLVMVLFLHTVLPTPSPVIETLYTNQPFSYYELYLPPPRLRLNRRSKRCKNWDLLLHHTNVSSLRATLMSSLCQTWSWKAYKWHIPCPTSICIIYILINTHHRIFFAPWWTPIYTDDKLDCWQVGLWTNVTSSFQAWIFESGVVSVTGPETWAIWELAKELAKEFADVEPCAVFDGPAISVADRWLGGLLGGSPGLFIAACQNSGTLTWCVMHDTHTIFDPTTTCNCENHF